MRWVFWLFLLFNAAFYYWQYTQPEKSKTVFILPDLNSEGVDNLVLLRERGLSPLVDNSPPPISNEMPPQDANEALVTEMPKALTKELPVNNIVSAVKPPIDKAKAVAVEPKPKPASPAAPEIILACFTLGPFQNEADAGKMYKDLLPLNIIIKQRLSERRTPKNYWVYLPPHKSYVAAREKVKALESKGLDDMFIMGAGEMKNAVSMGLFKRKSMAISRLNEVRAMDEVAVMKPQYRVTTERWLDLAVDPAATETVARLAELADKQAGVEFQQQKSCK